MENGSTIVIPHLLHGMDLGLVNLVIAGRAAAEILRMDHGYCNSLYMD